MRLTRRQVRLFYREAVRQEAHARADRLEDTAMALRGGKSLTERVSSLRGDNRGNR